MGLKLLIIRSIHLLIFQMIFRDSDALGINDNDCGSLPIKNFIVGGLDAKEHEFIFIVSLQLKSIGLGAHFCTASLLNERYILTAAHCLKDFQSKGLKPSDIIAVIGTNDKYKNISFEIKSLKEMLSTTQPTTQYRYEVNQWIIHGCFSSVDIELRDDIALLRLTKPIDIDNTNIGTICLPPKDSEPISSNITIAGWGVTSETHSSQSEDSPKLLQKADTTLVSEEYCQMYTIFRNVGLYGAQELGKRICVKNDRISACRGDSGGPAFQLVNNKMYQFGVTSFLSVRLPYPIIGPLFSPGNQCFKSTPNFYIKTSRYIDWISEQINKYKNSTEEDITTVC